MTERMCGRNHCFLHVICNQKGWNKEFWAVHQARRCLCWQSLGEGHLRPPFLFGICLFTVMQTSKGKLWAMERMNWMDWSPSDIVCVIKPGPKRHIARPWSRRPFLIQQSTLEHTQLKEAALPGGPALYTQAAVWSVGVGCQPLCVCKSLGNGSWMGAGSLFVCILQSFSLGRSGPLPLLASRNAIMPVGTASVSVCGTFPAAHTAVSLLLKEKSTWHSCTSSCLPSSSLFLCVTVHIHLHCPYFFLPLSLAFCRGEL